MGFSFSNKLFGGTGGGVQLPVSLENGGTGVDLSGAVKGDLIAGTGAGAVGLVNVGANGTVLAANDAVAGGVEWVAAPAAGAAGADTQVQFNDGGASLGGSSRLTFAKASGATNLTGPFQILEDADAPNLTLKRFGAAQTEHIVQWQTEVAGALGHIDKDGAIDATGLTLDNPLALTEGGTGADLSAVALGGLITGTGAGAVGVTAVGADGTFLKANSGAAGGVEWAAGGGGITNGAGANVITKSDGTNLVASTVTDDATTLTLGNAGVTVTEATGAVALTAQAATTVPLTVKGAGSQSANLQEWSTSTPAVVASIGPTGKIQSAINGGISLVLYDSTTGFGRNSSVGGIDFFGGSATVGVNYTSPRLMLASDNYVAWSASNVTQPADTIFRRRGAANPAWGAAAASPVAYTHNLAADARGGTDTNTAGASATLLPGIGTGTGAASRLLLGGPILGSTGSVAQTTATPVSIGGEVSADGTQSFVNVTGTLPASPSGYPVALHVDVIGAGSAARSQTAIRGALAAGYTGVRGSYGLFGSNYGVGGTTTGSPDDYTSVGGVTGVGGYVISANTSKQNIGGQFTAANTGNAGYAVGGLFRSQVNHDNSSAVSYGIAASGNANTGTNTKIIGGYFQVSRAASSSQTNVPGRSAVIYGTNLTTTAAIMVLADDTSEVFAVNDGGGVNLMREVEANTAGSGAPNVLVATESHAVLTNEGATAANYHTLPTAAKGLTFTFVVQDGDGLRVTANTDDTIRIAATVSAAAGYIEATTIGNTVTLVAINATEWVSVATNGTWTFGP